MREEGLRGVRKGRFVPRTTDRAHPTALHRPNVLQRRLSVDTAVRAWASDIPYAATRKGWRYLAVIRALQIRQVLGYSLSDRMPDERVLNALRNACHLAPPSPGTLFHSDRGRSTPVYEVRCVGTTSDCLKRRAHTSARRLRRLWVIHGAQETFILVFGNQCEFFPSFVEMSRV